MNAPQDVAVVAIGRNEGPRLRRCLESVRSRARGVVYVDSGSTDGSVDMARDLGAHVVTLDMDLPFTAARARNAGFDAARSHWPETQWVQFVDGDCEVMPDWLAAAAEYLRVHEEVAVVCGLRCERYPEKSIYNLLCDLDWNAPQPGPVKSCGGDAMVRVRAFLEVAGYRDDLIAGEEPEMCVRLRARGWQIHAQDKPMTLHDAALSRFGQWWTRTVRTGYAYAQGVYLHGRPPERHCVRPLRSAVFWALALPVGVSGLVVWWGHLGMLLLLLYPLQMARMILKSEGTLRTRLVHGAFLVVAKFAELQGALRFVRQRFSSMPARLIEYK